MNKFSTITIIAGLATALTTLAPSAAVFNQAPPRQQERPTPASANEPTDCADQMGHMRGVKRADIDAIHGQHVTLIAVCEDLTVAGKNNYGPLFVNGNVDTLRVPIARNQTLMSALLGKNYDQHDVVSLRFGANDSIILYVHQRDMN